MDTWGYSTISDTQTGTYHCPGAPTTWFWRGIHRSMWCFRWRDRSVLRQQWHPIAFFICTLVARHVKLVAYERELIGLVNAVQHWRPYLWGHTFLIQTDHFSLKDLLEQDLTTPAQQHWLSKLIGFSFRVEYKPGTLNAAADALSRRDESRGCLLAISQPCVLLLDELKTKIHNST